MADRAEMHANLMRAAGLDPHFEQREIVQSLSASDTRSAPRGPCRCWTLIRVRIVEWRPMFRSISPEAGAVAVNQREVFLLDTAILERLAQPRVSPVVLRDNQKPGSPFVDPMDNPRPACAPGAGQILKVNSKRVNQRPFAVPAPGWTTRPAGFSMTARSSSSIVRFGAEYAEASRRSAREAAGRPRWFRRRGSGNRLFPAGPSTRTAPDRLSV